MGRKVTALREAQPDRVSVELDGAAWRTLPVAAVVAAELSVGCELDRERARALRQALRRSGALDTAARALSRRDRSIGETDELLARRGFTAEERRTAVGSLEQLGYLDDTRFATSRADSLMSRGYGDEGIRFDLEQHGVTRELTEAIVAKLPPELERARRALGELKGPKAYRRLAAKGFSADTIEAAVEIELVDEDHD